MPVRQVSGFAVPFCGRRTSVRFARCTWDAGPVSGAHDRVAVRGTGGASSVIGVHFRAGGAAAFFGGSLGLLRNQTLLLEDRWGPAACELQERLQATAQISQKFRILEEALLLRLSTAPPTDPMVMRTLRALVQDPSVARITELQCAANCSPQPFIRRFEATVGLTPKRYARVLRFNALLARLVRAGPRDWARLAAASGYFDQSHLIHEFNRLSGLTPTRYRPVGADQPTHVAIANARGLSIFSVSPRCTGFHAFHFDAFCRPRS